VREHLSAVAYLLLLLLLLLDGHVCQLIRPQRLHAGGHDAVGAGAAHIA